ncbi:MAG: response regulator transcription factor [Gammaproteobacteria bacterium]|nr:response regulator transcription factor [Gammaproteobacteria bacterium]
MLVLLVEDDRDLAASVLEYLEAEGFEADYAGDGDTAWQRLQATSYDALVLDLGLPRRDGLDLCQSLRAAGIATPCLMLTARDRLDDKLAGFAAGADDYLIKPFALAELTARLRALGLRHRHRQDLDIAELHLDLARRQASRGGRALELGAKEWQLLVELARASPAVLSREQLEDRLWPDGPPSENAFKMVVYRLRLALDTEGESPLLHTLRGQGFALRPGERP